MPRHTPLARALNLKGANPRRAAAPTLPSQASDQAVSVQAALGPSLRPELGFGQSPFMRKSLFGSGVFSKAEMMKGFRVLSRPKLKQSQTKVAFPGVPSKK